LTRLKCRGWKGSTRTSSTGCGKPRSRGWLGEVAAIKATLAAAEQKLIAMRSAAAKHTTTTLGMPGFGPAVGRSSFND
jgi:hypothetical protein